MFEPVHGSAPKYAGKGTANPIAAVLSASLLLDNLGYSEAAVAVEVAVSRALGERVTTPDLGGLAATHEVGEYLERVVRGTPVEAQPV